MTNASQRRIASVGKAMRVLRLLANKPEGVGVTELALKLGVGKSSAHLLLATLAEEDFVLRRPDGRYQLGIGVFEVGAAAVGVASLGGPLTEDLRGLAGRCLEAVSLATANGADAIIVQRVESVQTLRAEIQVGTRMPLHASASGKFLLSQMAEDQIQRLFPSGDLPRVTPNTLTSRAQLLEEMREIRRRGYAWNREEYTEGVSGVATGIRDATDTVVLALSIAGPSHRFEPNDWLEDLGATAQRMSDILRGLAPVVLSSDDGEASRCGLVASATGPVEGLR